MAYDKIPSLQQWLTDTKKPAKGTGLFEIVCVLIEQYQAAKQSDNGAQKLYTVYLYYATKYWKNKAGTQYKSGPATGETKLAADADCAGPMADLNALCEKKIRRHFDIEGDANLDQELAEALGRPNPYLESDLALVKEGKVVWLASDEARVRYKARIRAGRIFRSLKLADQDSPPQFVPYDSVLSMESERKDGFVHYAMDRRGRLYIGYNPATAKFVHSSFTAGQAVICAGTMLVKDGFVVAITEDSGHYQPGSKNLRDLLVQLQIRGVNIGAVTAKHHKTGETMTGPDLLRSGKWAHSS